MLHSARPGSLIVTLVDVGATALQVMGAVVTLKEFTNIISNIVQRAREDEFVLAKPKMRGVKTVRELITLSRKSHADIDIHCRTEGEVRSVRLSRNEAEVIYLRDYRRRSIKSPAAEDIREARNRTDQLAERSIVDFAKAAAETSDDPHVLEQLGDAAFLLVRNLIAALTEVPGGPERLKRILDNLRAQGHEAAARLLERLINQA
jgi:hypothetical protein